MINEQMTRLSSAPGRPAGAEKRPRRRSSAIPVLLILFIAAFLRLYRLPELPPGLNFDEAGNGVAALEILNGDPRIWWRTGGGKEPLWPYLTAASTAILGPVPLALRLPAALAGILTVAAAYPLMLALFRGQRAYMIALLTTLGIALSAWHLHFSRLGFRAVLLPLLSSLAFYFLWRGFQTRPQTGIWARVWGQEYQASLLISALLTALAIYAYLAGRLLPLVVLLFLVLAFILSSLAGRRPRNDGWRRLGRRLIFFGLYLFIFLAPLMLYFAFNPADFSARSAAVSIFNRDWNNGDLWGTFWQTLALTLSTFVGLQGDENPLVNLPGQPALPLLLAPFFVLGLAISLYRLFRPGRPADQTANSGASATVIPGLSLSPHLFLLSWWSVMLLPAILAPEGAPHHLRLIGALTPTYAFVAVGLTAVIDALKRLPAHWPDNAPRTATLLPAAFYLFVAFQTYAHYFIQWPASVDFTLPFDLYAGRLAAEIAQAPPNVVYVLPMDIRAAEEARHYTIDYLLASPEPVQSPKDLTVARRLPDSPAYFYIPVDELNAEWLLSEAAAGKDELRVVRWNQDKHREADAKEIVAYLLESSANFAGRESFPVYEIETYILSGNGKESEADSLAFALPDIDQPVGAVFDGLLRLDAAYVPATAAGGDWLPAAITLAPLAPMDTDYRISIRLVGPNGERVAQKDRTLKHNYHQGTSLWPPETVNEYYLLPLPPEIAPGDYTVVAVIYHPETLAPLTAGGVVEAPLGTVTIDLH